MRKLLFPEIGQAYRKFRDDSDWSRIAQAPDQARAANQDRATMLQAAVWDLTTLGSGAVGERLREGLLVPLGL